MATAYTKHVVFDQNGGTELFGSIIHGGLTHRNSVAKVYWDHEVVEIEETFKDLTEDEIDDLLADDTVVGAELDVDTETGLIGGKLYRSDDRSQVRILAIPMEELIVPPFIRCLRTSPLIAHRQEKSKDELIAEGFDKALVRKLSDGKDDELENDPERLNRLADIGGDTFISDPTDNQSGTRKHVVYETYARIDADGTGTKLWKIIHCGDVVLDREQVARHPFVSYAPLPTPHRFWGENFAARVIPTQNAKTVLIRSILDHAVVANNPRYGVVKGALTNPRELLDNRLGGLVNVTRQDGIFPLPQAPLNPFVFQTIGMLDDDKEDVTGVSRLSQGLNKDAISTQNSQGMVEQLISASMQRQKTMARAFAAQFLAPLFLEVYRLVVENEKRDRIIDIAGSWVPVTPSSWERQRDVVIDFRLGYGEREQRAQEYVQLGTMLAQDPSISHLFGPDKRYNLYKAIMETKGHRDVAQFLSDPKTTPPPQPDPQQQLAQQQIQHQMQLDDRKQALAEKKAEQANQLEQLRADMEARFKTLDFTIRTHDQERKAAETENRIEVSQVEMELAQAAEERAADENVKATAIISPNG
ncbi:hypothetical protein ACFFF8_17920 [Novosphingobium clariflavum]|uniref:Portal protein n=1 Tax=Novosphingobium clariflavum TaxID=2029884 RepID=A0ABV6SB46_9SPHN